MESNTLLKVLPSKSSSDNADNSLFLVEVPNTEFISQIGEARAEIIGKENSSKVSGLEHSLNLYTADTHTNKLKNNSKPVSPLVLSPKTSSTSFPP